MSNDLKKGTDPRAHREQPEDAASALKGELMTDTLGRMFGEEDARPVPQGTPRVILALANHERSPGWDRAKVLQREMFEAAAGSGLEMKLAFYGPDDTTGVRRCRITTRWITDPDEMAAVMGRAECNCGCYVNIRDVLRQAVKENEDRPMRAVVIVGDAFHDDPEGLDEAALAANQLRRAGTRLFLIQQGNDPATARRLQWLAKVSGGAYFQFDPRTQERQFSEMLYTISAFASGGEEAVKLKGAKAATLLLEHLKQEPMPLLDKERERVRVNREQT
jgi:hypothetical protein